MTVRHWGEAPKGQWMLNVKDLRYKPGVTGLKEGRLLSYTLKVSGVSCARSEWVLGDNQRFACPWEALEKAANEKSESNWRLALILGSISVAIIVLGVGVRMFMRRRSGYSKVNSDKDSILLRKTASLAEIVLETPIDPRSPSAFEMRALASPSPNNYAPQTPITDIRPNINFASSSLQDSNIARTGSIRRMASMNDLPVINTNSNTAKSGTWDAGQLPSPLPGVPTRPITPPNVPSSSRMPRPKSLLSIQTPGRSNSSGEIALDESTLDSPKSPASKARVQGFKTNKASSLTKWFQL
jgi:hypothetical protein